MHAARRDGATCADIAAVLKVHAEQTRSDYAKVLNRHERIFDRDVSAYREVL